MSGGLDRGSLTIRDSRKITDLYDVRRARQLRGKNGLSGKTIENKRHQLVNNVLAVVLT